MPRLLDEASLEALALIRFVQKPISKPLSRDISVDGSFIATEAPARTPFAGAGCAVDGAGERRTAL